MAGLKKASRKNTPVRPYCGLIGEVIDKNIEKNTVVLKIIGSKKTAHVKLLAKGDNWYKTDFDKNTGRWVGSVVPFDVPHVRAEAIDKALTAKKARKGDILYFRKITHWDPTDNYTAGWPPTKLASKEQIKSGMRKVTTGEYYNLQRLSNSDKNVVTFHSVSSKSEIIKNETDLQKLVGKLMEDENYNALTFRIWRKTDVQDGSLEPFYANRERKTFEYSDGTNFDTNIVNGFTDGGNLCVLYFRLQTYKNDDDEYEYRNKTDQIKYLTEVLGFKQVLKQGTVEVLPGLSTLFSKFSDKMSKRYILAERLPEELDDGKTILGDDNLGYLQGGYISILQTNDGRPTNVVLGCSVTSDPIGVSCIPTDNISDKIKAEQKAQLKIEADARKEIMGSKKPKKEAPPQPPEVTEPAINDDDLPF